MNSTAERHFIWAHVPFLQLNTAVPYLQLYRKGDGACTGPCADPSVSTNLKKEKKHNI